MKKKENILILLSVLCAITLVPFGAFDKDFSLKIWYLTRIWLILFAFGLIKAFYPKWKAKFGKWKVFLKKKRKSILSVGIAVLAVICALEIWNIKAERVQALKRNQAVMAMVKYSHAGCFGFDTEVCVINRVGRWKCIDVYDERYEEIAGGEWEETDLTVETLDGILASPKIPYGLGKVFFTRKELNEAIRRKDVSYYYKNKEAYDGTERMYYWEYTYYNIQGARDRDVYLVGEKKTSEIWEDGEEVARLDAIYKKWIRVMEGTSLGEQDLFPLRKEEKKQVAKGFIRITLALLGLVLILGVFDGYMLRGWWHKVCWGYQKSNLSCILWIILPQIIFHIRIMAENATINFITQFFLIYCFTMAIWSFWEIRNWRRYCGVMKDKEKYKGLYYKGVIFLVTIGCCWFGAIINPIIGGIHY